MFTKKALCTEFISWLWLRCWET